MTGDELLRILRDDRSVPDLRTYFDIDTPNDHPAYTGARFDTLDDGGARDGVRNSITPYDLLAVACLGVTVPTRIALELVEGGPLGREITALLRDIPTNVALGEANASRLVRGNTPVRRAWSLLNTSDNVRWEIAGKVLARKRPRLIPVWDNVARCAYGRPTGNEWLWLDELLRRDGRLGEKLDELHRAADLSKLVSHLRVLHVVVWMRHRCEHRHALCPGLKLPPAD
jgi:hypothetical protein